MKKKLTKSDYIELHNRILKELIKDSDGNEVLDFNYYKQICYLEFNRKGEPKRAVYNPNAYVSEAEFKQRLERGLRMSRASVEVAEEMIELYDDACYGDGYAMASLGMDDNDIY